MIELLISFLLGTVMGAVLPAVLPVRSPEDFKKQYPNRSYNTTTVLWALIGGVVLGFVWTIGDYLFNRELAWNGVFVGLGWCVGALTMVFLKLRRLKRT